MNLIDRYVYEVGRRLPRKDRADIETELHSTLVDTLEDRVEGEPSEDDVVQILKEFGPPAQVAASYRGGDRYLVGPELFPLFRMVTGIVLLVLAIVQLVLVGVRILFTPGYFPDFEWIFAFLASLVSSFGYVVVTFAALQYFGVKPEMDEDVWDPRSLPEPTQKEYVSTSGLMLEIIFGLVLIALLNFLPDILEFISSIGVVVVNDPLVQDYLAWIIAVILLGIGVDVLLLWRGQWTTSLRLIKIGTNLIGIFILFVLIDAHTAWLASNGVGSGLFSVFEYIPEIGKVSGEVSQMLVMWAVRLALIIAFIVASIETIQMIFKLIRNALFPVSLDIPTGHPPTG